MKNTPPKFHIASKNGGWKTTFLLGRELFRGYVKLRGVSLSKVFEKGFVPKNRLFAVLNL